ncbi:MAG: hypothetical protein GF403_05540, partial [Candidatus Coatesbacteria bacterium]|nr:hypothetical protein [Candidatus Coatesbacteria bacterium]
GSIKSSAKNGDLPESHRLWFKALLESAQNAADEIVRGLDELSDGFDSTEGALLTLIIERDGKRLFSHDLEPIREAFVRSVIESFSSPISGVDSSKTPGACAVCFTDDRKVLGAVNPLRSFSVDKPGFAQGLQRANAWRNFPCCLDCALALERGQEYVASRLNFYFYGFKLYLVPHFSGGRVEEHLLETIANKFNEVVSDDYDPEKLGFAGGKLEGFQRQADRLLITAAKSEGVGAYDFIFYDIEQKAHRFLAVVPEVPREERLRKIINTKEQLDELAPFSEPLDKQGLRMFRFHFGLLRDKSGVLPKLGTHDPYGSDFLEIVQAILGRGRIEWDWLLGHLMRHLHESFNAWRKGERKSIDYPIRADLMLLYFLTDPEIGVVFRGGEPMTIEPDNAALKRLVAGDHSGPVEAAELAVEGNAGLLDRTVSQAVFLTGALTRLFMYKQWKERGATPFWGKLHSLRLTVDKVRDLLRPIRDKYQAYGFDTPTDFESLVSTKWLEVGPGDELSVDEASLLFTLGLNLGSYFFSKRDKNKEQDNE